MKNKTNPFSLITKIFLGFLLVIVLFLGVWIGVLSWRLTNLSQNLAQLRQAIRSDISTWNLPAMDTSIHEVSYNLAEIQKQLSPVFLMLRFMDQADENASTITQLESSLAYITSIAQAIEKTATGLEPLWNATYADINTLPMNERLYRVLSQNHTSFQQAETYLQTADQWRSTITPHQLPESLQGIYAEIDSHYKYIKVGIKALVLLPELLGSQYIQTYLLVAQNHDELRPTGGFLTGMGAVQFSQGKLVHISIFDSYRVDNYKVAYPPAPEPLAKYMQAPYWVPRDANWSPSFPTAAQDIQKLFQLSTNLNTEGVWAVDQTAIREMLHLLGPVTVVNVPQPVTEENIETYIEQAWSPEPGEETDLEWWSHRKDFMTDLGNALLAKVLRLESAPQFAKLFQGMYRMVQSGHILLFFNRVSAQSILSEIKLDGNIATYGADYLAWVDANIGFNKVDAAIERQLGYTIDFSNPAQPQGLVLMRYTHRIPQQVPCKQEVNIGSGVYAEMRERCYWDYWRLYVPWSSTVADYRVASVPPEWLLNGEGWPGEVATSPGENGTMCIAGVMVLPTNSQQEVLLRLRLAADTLTSDSNGNLSYILNVKKQAGLDKLPFILQVIPPEGYTLSSANPTGWKITGTTWIWVGDLNGLEQFALHFTPHYP